MTEEEQVKYLCKWIVDNGNRPLTDIEKELIKQAIDQSKSIEELTAVLLSVIIQTKDR